MLLVELEVETWRTILPESSFTAKPEWCHQGEAAELIERVYEELVEFGSHCWDSEG